MLKLLSQRNFGLLWTGNLVSQTGDWFLFTGLPLYIFTLTGSTLATGGLFVANIIPALLLGSVVGVFVDRWNRQRILVVINFLQALNLLPLLLVKSPDEIWIIYIVAFIENSLAQFTRPAAGALMPQVVTEAELPQANALGGVGTNVARLVGSPVGGVVAGLFGLSGVALVDAFSFLVAGLLSLFVRPPARPQAEVDTQKSAASGFIKVWSEWVEGLTIVRRSQVLTIIFALTALTNIGEGILNVLAVIFIKTTLHGGANEVGLFWGLQAAGGLVGGVIVGSLAGRFLPAHLLAAGSLGLGLLDLALFNYPAIVDNIAPGYAIIIMVGIPVAAYQAGLNTLLQLTVKDAYRGRVLGAFGTTLSLSSLVGTVFASLAGNEQNLIAILNLQGAGYTLAGFLFFFLLSARKKTLVRE